MRLKQDVRSVQALTLLKIIAQGEADVAAGRLVSQEEAFARANRVIDRASLPEHECPV